MTKFTLSTSRLASALHCVSTEETRYYLNGVCVSIDGQDITYDSTDGHVLYSARGELSNDADSLAEQFQVIIPTETVNTALKLAGRRAETIALTREGDKWSLGALAFSPIEGTFPSVERVFPKAFEYKIDHDAGLRTPAALREIGFKERNAQFAFSVLAKAAKALGVDKKGAMILRRNGGSPAVAFRYDDPDSFCLVMPLRGEDDGREWTWATHPRISERKAEAA